PGADAVGDGRCGGAAGAALRLAHALAVSVRAFGLEPRRALASLGHLQPQGVAGAGLLSAGWRAAASHAQHHADLPGQRTAASQRLVWLEVLGGRRRRLARPDGLLPAAGAAGVRLDAGSRPDG